MTIATRTRTTMAIVILGLTSLYVLTALYSQGRHLVSRESADQIKHQSKVILLHYNSSLTSSPLQQSSLAPTTDNNTNYTYRPWPKLVFKCGWHADLFANLVFPNVTHQDYEGFVSMQQLQLQANNQSSNSTNSATQSHTQEDVPLVVGMHGPCKLNEPENVTQTPRKEMWKHVQRYYTPGKAIFFNGEFFGNARGHNTYQVGTIAKKSTTATTTSNNEVAPYNNHSLSDFYYMSLAFLELAPTPQQRDLFFDHTKKPKNTGQYGVIYVASNCVTSRQEAADRISDVDPENLIVYYGAKCKGQRATVEATTAAATTDSYTSSSKLLPVPKKLTGRQQYQKNSNAFQQYRYCLVMENHAMSGYITEKIINAFLGGCVPIYYGTTEVFDIFNKDAFIFYDIHNPELALQQIRYMEKENHTAYDIMLAQPILANGTDTIERYFSIQDDIGGGKLIHQIRTMLGYDPNKPAVRCRQ